MSAARNNTDHSKSGGHGSRLLPVVVGAIGVVFGDIGTSPLYALKECFAPDHGVALTQDNVYGILSLVFWSLTLVVTMKYLMFILRADNKGEGGIMALLALVIPKIRKDQGVTAGVRIIFLGLFGAALLYGDGVITPAISVLSAVEGLEVATPVLKPLVVPITVAILIALFSVQSRGTAKIGAIFGPATVLWFIMIGGLGVHWILKHPEILMAVNPMYAISFFIRNGSNGFFILSAVVLCVTGGEALYADMGHFGRKAIRMGWYSLVMPALLLNYFGQGALILEKGQEALANPFYALVSGWMLYPLVFMATVATVIASQALITGAYSLTQQAVQLGYLPRVSIFHTSRHTEGQIYVPRVNVLLMVACITLVIIFQESTKLAAAYGIAVTGTMLITSTLFYTVIRHIWHWSFWKAGVLFVGFLLVDLAFFFANITKLHEGGWIPVLIAILLFSLMSTWKRGRQALAASMLQLAVPLNTFLDEIREKKPHRVKGTSVFLTLTRDIAPSVLLHHFKHNKVLHEKVILLSVLTENEPEVDTLERVRVNELGEGFFKVVARYGYIEAPNVPEILILCQGAGLPIEHRDLSFYVGRETFLTTGTSGMSVWRKKMFIFLSRNARPATEFFAIPPDQVIEIGSQIRI